VRALQASNAELVIICSYPLSSVGMVNTINELNYKPKMIGGAMVGLQATVFKQRLGAKLNGIVNYETWVPSEKLMKPAAEFFKVQARAGAGRRSARLLSRRLGLCLSQRARQAIEGAKSIEDDKIADYYRKNTFKTIMGDWAYGPGGEWTKSGMMQVSITTSRKARPGRA
jgi:branched-chain amino acid transport system substrate-binding protein